MGHYGLLRWSIEIVQLMYKDCVNNGIMLELCYEKNIAVFNAAVLKKD
jgi:cytochrome c oxidase subunit IV